jgi:hypothetical protein
MAKLAINLDVPIQASFSGSGPSLMGNSKLKNQNIPNYKAS